MINKDLYSIIDELSNESFANLTGITFILTLVKNVHKIEKELNYLDNIRRYSDKYKEYLKKVNDLRYEYSDKDINTKNPKSTKTTDGRDVYIVTERIVEFNEEIDKLKNSPEYSKDIKEQEKKNKEFEKELLKECKINFDKVSKKDLPLNLTFKQLYTIDFMIND